MSVSTIVCEMLALLNDMVMSEIKKCNRTFVIQNFAGLLSSILVISVFVNPFVNILFLFCRSQYDLQTDVCSNRDTRKEIQKNAEIQKRELFLIF